MASIRELGKKAVQVGVGVAIAVGSSPAFATEVAQTSIENSSAPCIPGSFFPETPILGEFIGAPVRVPASLQEIRPRSFQGFPGSEYFYPIFDPSTADAQHQYAGIGPHYGVAYQNLDGNYAADLISWGNVGELVIRAKNGGRVAISFEHEFVNQWQGTWYTDAAGHRVFNPNVDMAYWFEGLQPGQRVRVADADTGRQLNYNNGVPVIFYADGGGRLGITIPKTCNGDARTQYEFSVANGQVVVVRRGPNENPGVGTANSLPGGIIKPAVPGAY